MRHLILKTCLAGACALGFVALGGPAMAASPLSFGDGTARLILVQDEEDMAVEKDLRPDEVPEATEGEPMMEPKMEEEGESGGGDMEDKMIDEIGPGAE
jgi:hypothetical protein